MKRFIFLIISTIFYCTSFISNAAAEDILLIGDSIMQGIGQQLEIVLKETTETVTAVNKAVISSGLTNDNKINWLEKTEEYIKQYDPTTVVILLGTNDCQNMAGYKFLSPEWKELYSIKLNTLLSICENRQIFFILPPNSTNKSFNNNLMKMKQFLIKELLEKCFIISIDGFSKYHAQDGIHFTPNGYRILAEYVFETMEDAYKVIIEKLIIDETIINEY